MQGQPHTCLHFTPRRALWLALLTLAHAHRGQSSSAFLGRESPLHPHTSQHRLLQSTPDPSHTATPPPLLETWNASWGGFLPRACTTANLTTLVHWDTSVKPHQCQPDVCGGAVLPDIADLDGLASVADLCAGPLYDTPRTRACLRGRNTLFLGDSVLQVGCKGC